MKKFVFAAFAAPLALSACAGEETPAETEGAEIQQGETTTIPAVTAESQMNETRNATNQGTGLSTEGQDVPAEAIDGGE